MLVGVRREARGGKRKGGGEKKNDDRRTRGRRERARVYAGSTRASVNNIAIHDAARSGAEMGTGEDVGIGITHTRRRSLQFSARRPPDRSNANNVADANCR